MEIDQIIQDIVAFSDPFTEQKIKSSASKKKVSITRNARELIYEIDTKSGRIAAKHRKTEFGSVKQLLASNEFADIRRFSDTQNRLYKSFDTNQLIYSEISLNGELISADAIADRLTLTEGKVSLTLIDGPAGSGKTFQINKLAKCQAERFSEDNVSPPLLHITSRGRRLSNFRDVLAATTQELGASFGGRHVPILARHGLLIPAIDGFDELVDADGYEDSWRALREFIQDINGSGQLILAARDTFLDQQELLERIEVDRSSIELTLAHIKPISPENAVKFLESAPRWKKEDITSDITKDVFSTGSYALRPFFLNMIREIGGWSAIKSEGLRSYLVNSLLNREANIIAQSLGGITSSQVAVPLFNLFKEISLEMAVRENNLIELDHLEFLTTFCFEDILDEKSIRKLSHKAGSFSLLEMTSAKDKRKFPHTEIQYFFLGHAFIDGLSGRSIPNVLRRTIMSGEHLEIFAEVLASLPEKSAQAMDFLYSVLGSESSNDSLPINGAAILLLAFSFGLFDRIDYMAANEATFSGGTPRGILSGSSISRLDVCGSNISEVTFIETKIGILVVDEYTRFGDSVPDIDALEIRGSESRIERSPENIGAFIDNHKITYGVENGANHPAIKLLDKIVRRSIRFCYLKEHGSDDQSAVLLKDEYWKVVKQVLEKHRRIEVKVDKQMHGRHAPLIRIKNPRALLNHSDPETKAIIEEIASQPSS